MVIGLLALAGYHPYLAAPLELALRLAAARVASLAAHEVIRVRDSPNHNPTLTLTLTLILTLILNLTPTLTLTREP